jgi:hypothetical protein
MDLTQMTAKDVSEMDTLILVDSLKLLNEAYRAGKSLISDEVYDYVFLAEL